MNKKLFALLVSLLSSIAFAQEAGLVTRPSRYSVAETAERLEAAIKASGVYKLFFKLDHAANAEQEAGVKLPPSQLILFGNPKGGAPLLKASATIGIDLPNRALVWEDASGKVWITYNEIRTLFVRHGIKRTDEQIQAIEARQRALFEMAAD